MSVEISLEWSKMPSCATLYKLKTQIFLVGGGGGGMPPDPLGSYVYTPGLHFINISACTFIVTILHVFYRCLGYHIYMYLTPTMLCNYPPSPLPPINLLYTYNTCIKSMCISCVAVIHSNTQASPPPPKKILNPRYRTLMAAMFICINPKYGVFYCTPYYVYHVTVYYIYNLRYSLKFGVS